MKVNVSVSGIGKSVVVGKEEKLEPYHISFKFDLFKGSKMLRKVIETIRYKDSYFFVINGSIGNLNAS